MVEKVIAKSCRKTAGLFSPPPVSDPLKTVIFIIPGAGNRGMKDSKSKATP